MTKSLISIIVQLTSNTTVWKNLIEATVVLIFQCIILTTRAELAKNLVIVDVEAMEIDFYRKNNVWMYVEVRFFITREQVNSGRAFMRHSKTEVTVRNTISLPV